MADIKEEGTRYDLVLQSLGQAPVAAANVGHRRKAAMEAVAQHAPGVKGVIRRPDLFQLRQVNIGCVGMGVKIDESRHQRLSADVDDFGLRCSDFPFGDLANMTAVDQDRKSAV